MKPKAKSAKRNRKPVAKKVVRKTQTASKRAQPEKTISQPQREILVRVWSGISDKTKFVELPEHQTMVSYTLPSGETNTTTLAWYTFSHGPRVYGHYDEANDVCYVSKIIE